jgi:hypothetical protein
MMRGYATLDLSMRQDAFTRDTNALTNLTGDTGFKNRGTSGHAADNSGMLLAV